MLIVRLVVSKFEFVVLRVHQLELPLLFLAAALLIASLHWGPRRHLRELHERPVRHCVRVVYRRVAQHPHPPQRKLYGVLVPFMRVVVCQVVLSGGACQSLLRFAVGSVPYLVVLAFLHGRPSWLPEGRFLAGPPDTAPLARLVAVQVLLLVLDPLPLQVGPVTMREVAVPHLYRPKHAVTYAVRLWPYLVLVAMVVDWLRPALHHVVGQGAAQYPVHPCLHSYLVLVLFLWQLRPPH